MKWHVPGGLVPLILSACVSTQSTSQTGDVVARSLDSAVQLFAAREGGVRRAGSGVILAVDDQDRALILTAGHLLLPEIRQTVTVHSGSSETGVEAAILALDSGRDIAVLEATVLGAKPARLKHRTRLGDSVWVVSFPWGRRGTVVKGVVSQIDSANDDDLLPFEGPVGLIDAAVSYGTSGGGVFDGETGRLVGIIRGYRTAKLAMPGTEAAPLEFPIAGETTVIPTSDIICLLRSARLADRLSSARGRSGAEQPSC